MPSALEQNQSNGSSSSRVKVHSKLTVVGKKAELSTKGHNLSVLDHAMGNHTLHIIFYYKNGIPGTNRIDLGEFRMSLCEVLALYPTATGRLQKDNEGNWKLSYNDAGIRVFRAAVGVGIDEWLETATAEEEMNLTVWDDLCNQDETYIWPPIRIQVNEFEGGGLAIGLSSDHLLADPTCATLFMKSLTEAYRGEAINNPPLIHPQGLQPRASMNHDTKSTQFYASKASNFKRSTTNTTQFKKMSSATFSFSDSAIRNSLNKIHNASPFDFLAALFWSRITQIKAKGSKTNGDINNDDHSQNSLTICMDFRKLLQKPLPYGYFGNAIHFTAVTVDDETLLKGEIGQVARVVNNHVSSLREEEFLSAIDWFSSRKDDNGKYLAPFRMYGPELTCVNVEQTITGSESGSTMYMAYFKKGEKPIHVSYRFRNVDAGQSEDEGLIQIMPSPEKGMARRVTVTLPEKEMVHLCADEEIMSLEPTLLLTGRR